MKRLKAYWLRYWHVLLGNRIVKGDHHPYTVTQAVYIFGIPAWDRTEVIGCICGKKWYDKLT